jgi:hypothetical protein
MDTHACARNGRSRLAATLQGLTLLIVTFTLAPASVAADSRFEAFDVQTGALLFQGRVTVSTVEGIVTESTEYARADGTVIHTKLHSR